MKIYALVMVLLTLLFNNKVFCQSADTNHNFKNQVSSYNDSLKWYASDNLFIQFDKPNYTIADTIWFKAYVLNLAYLSATDKSGFLYIEIADNANKVIKQYKTPINYGISCGNIILDKSEFVGGSYIIRAYTTWMRNFPVEHFFYKSIYITNAQETWLVTKDETFSAIQNNTAKVKLRFSSLDKKPLVLQSLNLKVLAGNKSIYQKKLQTDTSGYVDVNFDVPQYSLGLKLIAENDTKDKRLAVPLILNRAANIDVQFFPEGGKVVAGLPARFGFKAIAEDGLGKDISGVVTDQNQQQVALIKTPHNGMGSFSLYPRVGDKYTAKVTLEDGTLKEYSLSTETNSGIVLQVKNPMESDSVEVFIAATNDIVKAGDDYFLFGKARGIVCYAAIVNFQKNGFVKQKISKNLFPSGITHIILTTAKYQTLNERLIYIDHKNILNLQIKMEKSVYSARESIRLQTKVTDYAGNPVIGNFSLAVTDDAQVKTDSLNAETIISRFFLTSELRGNVEEPGYYFKQKTKDKWLALDNLLLTQGWVDYDLVPIFKQPTITFQPEHHFEVTGFVKNVFNTPVQGTDVLLFSKSPTILMDTSTNKAGKFVFNHFPAIDTPIFILKAMNKHGKSFNVKIIVDEINPPVFIAPPTSEIMPWYLNSDTTLLNYTKLNGLAAQQQYVSKGVLLKEVVIKAKKVIKGSANRNGSGEADFVLDEKDLEKAGKKNWLQLLQENIKGFHEVAVAGFVHNRTPSGGGLVRDVVTSTFAGTYKVDFRRVIFIIDGIQLDSAISMPNFRDLTYYLESHSVEDIKGIELNFSPKYSNSYVLRFMPGLSEPDNPAFIEITTRSGQGPFLDNTPGVYLYKPSPISKPTKFYKPKYNALNSSNSLLDFRSTIDWEPNITTNASGEATISFFSADMPSTYSIVIQGTDMKGNIGYIVGKIRVDKPNTKSK